MEYDAAFALMVAQVNALDLARKPAAARYLRRLGDGGCLSGTREFASTVEALDRMGVTGSNHIFHSDRQWIASNHLPAKLKETAQ